MILKGGRSGFSQSRRGRCRLELVRAGHRHGRARDRRAMVGGGGGGLMARVCRWMTRVDT